MHTAVLILVNRGFVIEHCSQERDVEGYFLLSRCILLSKQASFCEFIKFYSHGRSSTTLASTLIIMTKEGNGSLISSIKADLDDTPVSEQVSI
jgi:hypothetical protein